MVDDFKALQVLGLAACLVWSSKGSGPQGSSAQQSPKTAFMGSEFRQTCTRTSRVGKMMAHNTQKTTAIPSGF